MSPPIRSRSCASFSREMEDEESAAVAIFLDCCRQSPDLRRWLSRDFVRSAAVRSRFADLVRSERATGTPHSFANLAGENRALQEEQRRLTATMPQLSRPYGGRSWAEMEALVRRHQAGMIDLGTFLLAQTLRRAARGNEHSLALTCASAEFMKTVVQPGGRRLLRHLDKALRYLKECEDPKARRAALGYQDRWKLHALFFMLRHPGASYRTREIRDHLATTLGLAVDARDIRRFCTRHGIKRDVRAGRPRTRIAPWDIADAV